MDELINAVMPFIPEGLVAGQEGLPQAHQSAPLEVIEGPSTFNDLCRLEWDQRLVIPAKSHLRDIVTSVNISYSVAPSEEGVTVLPQTGGGQSGAAERVSTGQNRPAELEGPSSRQWWAKSPSDLNSSDLQSLAKYVESLPEPGEEVNSSTEALAQAPAPAPNPEFLPLLYNLERIRELKQTFSFYFLGKNEVSDLLLFDRILAKAITIERNIQTALLENGFNPERVNQRLNEIRRILFYHPTKNLLLSEKTLDIYIQEIRENGTMNSTPYRNIMRSVKKYDLIL